MECIYAYLLLLLTRFMQMQVHCIEAKQPRHWYSVRSYNYTPFQGHRNAAAENIHII